jgi:Gpi18-like mannosyltransferase
LKLSPWFVLVLPILLALIIGSIFRYPLVLDDPFITYRYAHNLLAGEGFVYNSGEHVLSTTTPLYALILASLGLVFRDIPSLGFWLSVVSYAVCAWFVYLIAAHFQFRAAGLLAALLTLVSPGVILTFGLETGFYLALAFAAIYFYLRGRVKLGFALLSLLTLTRNDGVLLAIVLGAHFLLRFIPLRFAAGTRALNASRPQALPSLGALLQPFVIYLLILAPWLIFAWWWFGTPLPFTLTAKIAQAQSGLWDSFAMGFMKWLIESLDWSAPLLVFIIVGAVWAIRARTLLLLIAVWAILYRIAYTLLGVAFYAWYVAPLLPVAALFAGSGVEVSARGLGSRLRAPVAAGVIFALVGGLMLILELRADVSAGMNKPSPKVDVYHRAAEWIAQNTPTSATIDALEVGVIGYYDERRTLDFVGLVDPSRIPYLRMQKFAEGVRRASADYVIAIPPDTWLPNDLWFPAAYRPVREIRAAGFYGGKPLVIYQRADAGRTAVETRAVNLIFEKRIELQTADLFSRTAERGEILPVALHLRVREANVTISPDWKFTLQLVGAENRVVAQSDNFFPARLPEDGKSFIDHQGVPIPREATGGSYDFILAMYHVKSGERLSLFDANGNEVSDFVSLGKIEIK